MRCREFDTRLQQVLDARQEPAEDPLLRQHALRCPPCQTLLDLQSALLDGIELHPAADVSDAARFTERVLLAVDPPRLASTGPSSGGQRLLWAACSAATLLLLAAGPFVMQRYFAPVQEDEPPIAALAPSAGELDLGRESLDSPSPAGLGLTPVTGRLGELQLRSWWNHWNPRAVEPVDRLAGGLRPLANSFHVAIDALRKTWPDGRDGSAQPQA